MRIVLIGAEGTVGQAAYDELKPRHEIITAGRKTGDERVDLASADSIAALYSRVGDVDAVICCAGHVHFGPLQDMTQENFMVGLTNKVMGQVNLVLIGQHHLKNGGSFTLTSGVLDRDPVVQGANAATANAALQGFVTGAAIELDRGLRLNVVSPGLLTAAAEKYAGFFPGHESVSSQRVGLAYAKSVEGRLTGKLISVA